MFDGCKQYPELNLCVDAICAHYQIPSAERRRRHQVNWKVLESLCMRHNLFYPLHAYFRDSKNAPGAIRERYQLLHDWCGRRAERCKQSLLNVTSVLNAVNVHLVAYKGVAQSLYLYGSETRRVGNDVDILVPREDMLTACNSLLQNGFQFKHALSQRQLLEEIDKQRVIAFRDLQQKVVVELHSHVVEKRIHDAVPDKSGL